MNPGPLELYIKRILLFLFSVGPTIGAAFVAFSRPRDSTRNRKPSRVVARGFPVQFLRKGHLAGTHSGSCHRSATPTPFLLPPFSPHFTKMPCRVFFFIALADRHFHSDVAAGSLIGFGMVCATAFVNRGSLLLPPEERRRVHLGVCLRWYLGGGGLWVATGMIVSGGGESVEPLAKRSYQLTSRLLSLFPFVCQPQNRGPSRMTFR